MKIREPGCAGLSRIELICIILLIAVALGLAIMGVMFYKHSMARGDDAMKENTCERVATFNLLENGCVVTDCDRTKNEACIHEISDGVTIGYFNAVEKKVFADKPQGYNEFTKMKIGKRSYYGDVNTMVIMVRGEKDKVKLSWVPGSK